MKVLSFFALCVSLVSTFFAAVSAPLSPHEVDPALLESVAVPHKELSLKPTPAKEAPKASQEKKTSACAASDSLECMPNGLNTVDVDAHGNWVVKRAYWEQAEKAYEKITKLNNEFYDIQMNFTRARNDNDKDYTHALKDIGLEQEQLRELIEKLLDELKHEREQRDELTVLERTALQDIKQKQTHLEAIHKNLQFINDLHDAISQVVDVVAAQVSACRSYEEQAWQLFKEIGQELNDKKARDMFYTIDNLSQSVQQSHDYVVNDLQNYLNNTIDQIKKRFGDVRDAVKQFEANGLSLGSELDRLIAQDKNKDAAAAQAAQKERERLAAQAKQRELEARKTWSGWLNGNAQDVWQCAVVRAYQAQDFVSRMYCAYTPVLVAHMNYVWRTLAGWYDDALVYVKGLFGYKPKVRASALPATIAKIPSVLEAELKAPQTESRPTTIIKAPVSAKREPQAASAK